MIRKRLLSLVLPLLILLLAVGGWWYDNNRAPEQPFRIGVVSLTEVDNSTLSGFKEGMQALGYVEGKHVQYLTPGPAGNVERLDPLIAELLQQGVDLLLVSSTPATLRVKEATAKSGIPVVFAPVNDPVSSGIVDTLKHPGGNITGIKLPMGDKLRIQWLTELVPNAKHVYFPYTPSDKSSLQTLAQIREAVTYLGITLLRQPLIAPDSELLIPDEAQAIFIPRDSTLEARIDEFAAISRSRLLPISAPSLIQVEAGALYTYGFIHHEFGKQAARLTHQIIQGVSPADIPVEVAESYLAINLRSAEECNLQLNDEVLRKAHILLR